MIHARSEWADIAPHWAPARKGVGDVFIHHEGGARRGVPKDKAAVLREIEHGVLPMGYIATDYNLMVFQDGDVWEGRGLEHEDGATINNNPTSVSICAVGNFETEAAPDGLIAGIAAGVDAAIAGAWTSKVPNIRPHRAVFPTACPGAHLYARLDDIRAEVGHPVKPAPPQEDVNMAQADYFITTEGTDTWWFYNGNTKRPLDPGENQQLVDLGVVRYKVVKRIAPETLKAIPDFYQPPKPLAPLGAGAGGAVSR